MYVGHLCKDIHTYMHICTYIWIYLDIIYDPYAGIVLYQYQHMGILGAPPVQFCWVICAHLNLLCFMVFTTKACGCSMATLVYWRVRIVLNHE